MKKLINKIKKIDIWWFVGLTGLTFMVYGIYSLGMNLIESYL